MILCLSALDKLVEEHLSEEKYLNDTPEQKVGTITGGSDSSPDTSVSDIPSSRTPYHRIN